MRDFKFGYIFLLLIAGIVISCSPKRTPPGASSISGSVPPVPYSYHYWEEGLGILIWHDFSYGSEGCSGTGSTEDPVYRLECNVQAQDGRRFSWEVHTSDGITADMWIEGQPYDLSQGNMFLVKSGDDGLDVVQLQRDFAEFTGDYQKIADWAETDPDVANFIDSVEAERVPAAEPPSEDDESTEDAGIERLLNELAALNQPVELGGKINQPFFSVPGQIILLGGEEVQVFIYPDAEQAGAEAGQISPNGSSIGTSMVTWVSTPHFYAKDNLIALYVGENDSVAAAVSQVLGSPVAEGQGLSPETNDDGLAETPLSFEAVTYRNEENGFAFDYPAGWNYDEQVLGSRGSGALFNSGGEVNFSAIIYLWDPKHDLDAYSEQRKLGWSSSSTVTYEEELALPDGQRAMQFEIQGPDGSISYSLLTVIGDKYLELSGTGERELMREIFQTLRLSEAASGPPMPDQAAFEDQVISAVISRDFPQMQVLMDETFGFAFWGSEGFRNSPEEASGQFQQTYLSSDQIVNFNVDAPDLSDILGPGGIMSVWDPARNPVDALFSTGWGPDGQDEAYLIISQKPDGSHAWDGIIFASGSYGGFEGLYDQ